MTRSTLYAMLCILAMLGISTGMPSLASAQEQDQAQEKYRDTVRCRDLADLAVRDVSFQSSVQVKRSKDKDLPAYCRVLGTVRPAISFEVRLPVRGWNGRYYQAGCGGMCGFVDSDSENMYNAINYGLRRGYAAATSDAGHWGSGSQDARWAYNNFVAEHDFGYRNIESVRSVAIALVQAYYGTEPARTYFNGCSTGGRLANRAALEYPEAFDGILSGAPALVYPALVATFMTHLVRTNTAADGSAILDPAKVPMIADVVTRQCDLADGVPDHMIDDPRLCAATDFSEIACPAGEDRPDCLTVAEIRVIDRWHTPLTNDAGVALYPGGLPQGSEAYWGLWLTGYPGNANPLIPYIPPINLDFLRYVAFEPDKGPTYQRADFNMETDPNTMTIAQEILNSDDPDIDAFRAEGGKMLMYHGWADPIVTPYKTTRYYEAVSATLGQDKPIDDFLRLFMIPGFDHCGAQAGGPGIDQWGFAPFEALERWVEDDQAPETLMMTKTSADGETLWRRPACQYPQRAVYSGLGPWQDADNWTCE